MSPMMISLEMFTEPGKAFKAIQDRSMLMFPLLLSMIGTALLYLWYYQIVDLGWLIDSMTAAISDPSKRSLAKKFMTKQTMTFGTVGGLLIWMPLYYVSIAQYFQFVGRIKSFPIGFGKWFAFAVWSSIPALLLLPIGAVQIMLSQNGQLLLEQLNPTSLNQLVFHVATGNRWQILLESVSLTSLWSVVLMVVGYQVWTKQSRLSSVLVVMTPYVLIYGAWIGYILMKKPV